MNASGNSQGGSDVRKHPSEKRKLQNRAAQRKYREKLRTKLASLENSGSQDPSASGTWSSAPSQSEDSASTAYSIPTSEDAVSFLSDTRLQGPETQMIQDTEGLFQPNFDQSMLVDNDTFAATFDENFMSSNLNSTLLSHDHMPSGSGDYPDVFSNSFGPFDVSDMDPHFDSAFQSFEIPNQVLNYDITNKQHGLSAMPPMANAKLSMSEFKAPTIDASKSPMQLFKTPVMTKPVRNSQIASQEIASEITKQLQIDDSNESRSLVKTAIARGFNIKDVLLEGLKSLGKRESSNDASRNDSTPLPNLHRNALTLTRWSTLRAYFTIAKVLDFSSEDLHSKTFVSPFYQPEAAEKGELNTILATYNAKAIRNLRPTAAQILHKHHPWLDIIPFPSIRERTLTLASLSPPLVDMIELQNDIFLNDGLFCWKSDGKRGDGQPWDLRSWEAEPWFLNKWWMLLGGEESEVWEQTQYMVAGHAREGEGRETHNCVLRFVLSLGKGEKIDNFDCQGPHTLLAFSPFDIKPPQTFGNATKTTAFFPAFDDEEDRDLISSALSNFPRRPSLFPSKRYTP